MTTASSSQSVIEASFDIANTHRGGEHLESTVMLKGGLQKNIEDDYFHALKDILFDIDNAKGAQCQLVDAQLMWNSGLSFSQWHADKRPRASAAWSQLQHGRKLWFVASGQPNLLDLLRSMSAISSYGQSRSNVVFIEMSCVASRGLEK